MSIEPLTKPSRLARDVSKWKRQQTRAAARAKADRQAAHQWTLISNQVWRRDKGKCRVCGFYTLKSTSGGDPRLFGQAHHIVYRSAGGTDDLSNLVWIHAMCHEDEHTHKIRITGTADALEVKPL